MSSWCDGAYRLLPWLFSCLELEVFPSPGLCLGQQCVQVYGFFSFPVL